MNTTNTQLYITQRLQQARLVGPGVVLDGLRCCESQPFPILPSQGYYGSHGPLVPLSPASSTRAPGFSSHGCRIGALHALKTLWHFTPPASHGGETRPAG